MGSMILYLITLIPLLSGPEAGTTPPDSVSKVTSANQAVSTVESSPASADSVEASEEASAEPKVASKPTPRGWDPEFLMLFEEPTIHYTGRGYYDKEFKYRLFVPEIKSKDERFPLIVWLHGHGERGGDNIRHLKFINEYVMTPPYLRGRYPFFLLALQCPHDNSRWTTTAENADDMLNVIMAALNKTLQENPAVDISRIPLIGVSAGGTACWELAMRHPDMFSCVAPTASSGGDNIRVSRLVGIPVWAFHSTRDRSPPIGFVRDTVRALKAAGGHVELTEINSSDHFCWRMAFDDYNLLGWLLHQRRSELLASRPSKGNQSLVPTLAALGCIVSVVFLFCRAWNRRRNSLRKSAD